MKANQVTCGLNLEGLKKIEKLVESGATVVGQKPTKATGLKNYPASDLEVKRIADKLWGKCDGKTITENVYEYWRNERSG